MRRQCRYIVHFLLVFLYAISLTAQSMILEPAEGSCTDLNHILVSALGHPGDKATLFVNDTMMVVDTFRVDGLVEFLNVSVPKGPVVLKVVTVGRTGQMFENERSIHVNGPVHSLVPEGPDIELPADGSSTEIYRFSVKDEWGYMLKGPLLFTANITAGEILDPDLDSLQSGFQKAVDQGVCEVAIKAPRSAVRATLELEVAGHTEQFSVMFTTSSEPFVMLGTLNAAMSFHPSAQQESDLSTLGLYERNTTTLSDQAVLGGRTAFYGTGALRPGYRLTASFDTDRGYMDQLFSDVDPEDPYPLYGDASTIVYDAQSRSKLYAKVEHNESFVLYGDYNTGLLENEFTAYNRTFNGMLANWKQDNHEVLGFASLTDREMVQEEVPGQGISGYYYLQNGEITRFSEKVRILVRDRYHSETLLEVKEQTRFLDYDINYVDGTLMFKQAVPGVDADGNPVFIVISYEHQSRSKRSLAGGIRYQGLINEKLHVGATLITEDKGIANYFLYGLDFKLPVNEWLSLNGELAESRDPVLADSSMTGQALRAEVQISPDARTSFKGYYRFVDNSFNNNSQVGKTFEGGSEKVGLNGRYQLKKRGEFLSELYQQQSTPLDSRQVENRVFTAQYQLGNLKGNGLHLGYENAEQRKGANASDSVSIHQANSLNAGFNLILHKKLQGSMEHQQNLSSELAAKPTNTSLGLKYLITEKVSLYWQYRLVQSGKNEHQNIIGIDSKITENTQLFGKYEINGISSEARNRASIGLNNKWELTDDIRLNVAYENTASIDSFEVVTPDHQSLALACEYLPAAPWKLAVKYELRDDQTSRSRVSSLGGDARIFRGFGLISKLEYFENAYKAVPGEKQTRANYQAGFAYRPEENDVLNILAKVAFISEKNTHSSPTFRQDRLIASIHAYWQVFNRLGLGARMAQRSVLDEEGDMFSDKTRTLFASLRPEVSWNLKWSSAMDIRYMQMYPLNQSSTGLALETDYLLKTNTQIGVGYILSNFADSDFSYENYQFKNFYVSLHLKFSEDIFNWR